jgi:hypothetical protein
VAAVCVVAAGCGGSATSPGSGATQSAKPIAPPSTVEARPLTPSPAGYLRRGRLVGRFSGMRVFANARDGFAIGFLARTMSTYPLVTGDGGKAWRVAGPVFQIPAADGAATVSRAGMVGTRVWFACCGGESIVDVTADAGRRWWGAFLPGDVLSVYAGQTGQLVAVVQPYAKPGRLWTYESARGRRWVYTTKPVPPA